MMGMRDLDIIRHIAVYCSQIETAHMDFGHDKETFLHSTTYQNAICMCILQIGELVGKLTEDFKGQHTDIPWRQIRGMRNFVAHEYGNLDPDVVWYTANEGIAELKAFCEKMDRAAELS